MPSGEDEFKLAFLALIRLSKVSIFVYEKVRKDIYNICANYG